MAAARRYEQQSVVVGLEALRHATATWLDAVGRAPADVLVPHPTMGLMGRDDYVRRQAHEVVHHAGDVRARSGATAAR